jgi:D-beta-D-heptose 7-phosphate kinase/D-beta-D-heptose 1-phosphate adenosyltransferase
MSDLDLATLPSRLDAFAGQPILVLGDLMLDRYLWGDTQRISPEAPVPVIDAGEETARLGGAANVANNVHALGANPALVGVTGSDGFGHDLRRLLEDRELDVAGVVVDPGRRTTCKTRVMARHQQVVRIDREDPHELSGSVLEEVRARALSLLSSSRACIISDYGKGMITPSLLDPVLERARELQVPVCVDPKETHFFRFRAVTTITPNQSEASVAAGFKIVDERSLLEAGRILLQKLESDSVLITRGDRGMALFQPDRPPLSFPALARDVFDVTGAGDTVVSVFALAIAAGADLAQAAAISNHAAGLVVREVGTAVCSLTELRDSLASAPERWLPTRLAQPEPA